MNVKNQIDFALFYRFRLKNCQLKIRIENQWPNANGLFQCVYYTKNSYAIFFEIL